MKGLYEKRQNKICNRKNKTKEIAKNKNPAGNPNIPQTSMDNEEEPPLPDHVVLYKDKELRVKAKELAGKTSILEAEYRLLLEYVKKNINKQKTVAQLDKNREHNRYIDIGAYKITISILTFLFQPRSMTTT